MTESAESWRSRNHGLWLAPILALGGFLSYWGFFARWPIFRDDPWLNLLVLGGAIALSIAALRRAWPSGVWHRIAGIGGVALSSALTVLLLAYCYGLSYQLPSADLAVEAGEPIPPVVLASHDGGQVDLGAAGSERMLLVFYRGFW